nr:DUF1360 domain-containing protein [Streptomyces taklimakanensis]
MLELGILGAAAYRATQLGVHDSILDPLRDRVFAWHANRPDSRPRDFVVTLISCTYCLGWWISGAILLTYLLATGQFDDAPLPVHGIEWFAVAGVQALGNRRDDTWGRAS